MKKIPFLFILLFAAGTAKAQFDCLKDTVYYYHYDPGTTTKIYDSRTITSFSASGKLVQQTNQSWNTSSGTWVNSDKAEMQYNASDLLAQQINFIWNTTSSIWVNQTRYQLAYTAAGLISEELIQTWGGATSSWVGYGRYTYQYNINNLEINRLYFIWDAPTTAWVNVQNRVRTYSGANLLNEAINDRASATSSWETTSYIQWLYNLKGKVTESVYQNSTSGTLANFQRKTYTYNSTDTLVTEEISQNWNTATSVWDNSVRLLNTYNANSTKSSYTNQWWDMAAVSWRNSGHIAYSYNAANKIVDELWQNWDNSFNVWVNNIRVTTSYNTSQNPTEVISYNWDATTSSFILDFRNRYLYNAAQKQTERRGQRWNTTLGNWGESNLELREYNSYGHQIAKELFMGWDDALNYYTSSNCERYSCRLVPNGIEEAENAKISIYPNPLAQNIFTARVEESSQLIICNMHGQLVHSQKLEVGENRIELSACPSGVYIVQIGNKTQKLIKQ